MKRKDGKYSQQALWYKVLNPTYTQKAGRQEFFQRQPGKCRKNELFSERPCGTLRRMATNPDAPTLPSG
jgi:hypothetical protein